MKSLGQLRVDRYCVDEWMVLEMIGLLLILFILSVSSSQRIVLACSLAATIGKHANISMRP